MAVIVKVEKNGSFIFRSIKGLELTKDDEERAIKLNNLVKKSLRKFVENTPLLKSPNKKFKNKAEVYWEFGKLIRDIYFKSGLVEPSEKNLFLLNVYIHAPSGLLAKDRGPNRRHIEYCFRLAGYPKKLAEKMKWSEWVYLFDSPSIKKELRFDKWNELKIIKEPENINRKNIRLFAKSINSILKDMDASELSDDGLNNCYDAAWELAKEMIERDFKKETIIRILKGIVKKRNDVGDLIGGINSTEDFVKKQLS